MGESPASQRSRPARVRRVLRALGLGAGALAAVLVFLYVTREALLLPWLGERARAALERRTGASLRLGALSGDLFTTLELRDVRFEDARPGAVAPRAEIGWARLRYDPWRLARGDLTGLTELEAERVRVEVDAGAGADEQGAADDGAAWSLPAHLPRVRLRDAAVRVDHAAGSLRLAGAELELAPRADGAQALALRASQAVGSLADGRAGSAALAAELALSGSRVELASLRLDGVERARDAWLELARAGAGAFAWGGTLSLADGELALAGALEQGRLELDLTPSGVRLGPFLALLRSPHELPDARLDGSLQVVLETARPADLRVSWNGRIEELRWRGRAVERLDGEATWESGLLRIARLDAAAGGDRLRASDVSVPIGADALATLRGARGSLRLESVDVPALLRGVPEAEALGALGPAQAPLPAHRLELALVLEEGAARLEQGSLALPDGGLRLRAGSLHWGERGWRDARLDLGLEFDVRDLAGLARLVAAPRAWSGALAGRVDLRGSVDDPAGELSLDGSEVVAAGLALGEVEARADVDPERLRVESFASRGAFGRVEARGTYAFAERTLADVELSLDVPELASLSGGRLAAGALALKARLSGPALDPQGAIELDARDLSGPLLAGRRVARLQAAARLEPGRVACERLVAEVDGVEIEAAGALGHARFAAPFALELERFAARRGALDLALVEPMRARWERGATALDLLHLSGSAGDLRLRGALSGDDFELALRGERLDPMPLLAPWVAPGFELAGATCDLRLARSGGELELEGELAVERLRPAADLPDFALSASGSLAGGRARLEHLRLSADDSRRLELAGEAPLRWGAGERLGPGPISLRGSADVRALERLPWERFGLALPLTGDLGLDLEVGGDRDALAGRIALRGERLALVSPRARTELFGPARLSGQLEFDGRGVRLRDLELRAPDQAALLVEGSLAGALRPRAWSTGDDGGLGDAALAGLVRLDAAELEVAARFSQLVRRLGGKLFGEVRVAGTPRAPRLAGRLEIEQGELRLTGDVPALAALSARVDFTHTRLSIAHLRGEIGGGPLEVSGEVDWSGGEPRLDLRLQGSEVLLVQRPELRLRSDVELALSGPLAGLELEGELALRDGRWSKRIEFYRPDRDVRAAPPTELELFSFEAAPLADLRLSVEIRSAQPFVIANNLVKGELDCDLRLGGTGRAPDLSGSLFVGPTTVRLPATNLTSQGGTIRFDRDDPLVPRLDVRFTTRTRGYDVQLRLQGTSLEPEVDLSSSPPMTDEDLILLVLTGKVPDSPWGESGAQGAAENVAFFIGKDIVQGWFESDSEGESFFDRIDWRTGVDVSHSGAKTTEISFRLKGPQTGPGRTLLLRAEQDIYDHDNIGLRFVLRRD